MAAILCSLARLCWWLPLRSSAGCAPAEQPKTAVPSCEVSVYSTDLLRCALVRRDL